MSDMGAPPVDPQQADPQAPQAPPQLPDPTDSILNAIDQCATACGMAAASAPDNADKLASAVLKLSQGIAALNPPAPGAPAQTDGITPGDAGTPPGEPPA